ncbi:CapA family protein [Natronorarus salvus]|uniref:CapA family protein n=1 Tax=Natronorarus salvus TaxID=3117733 RepID=UPI002F26D406
MTDATLALAGDAIVTQRLRTRADSGLDRLVETIRGADAAVANLEVLLTDGDGIPAARSGGTYMDAPSWVADELVWMGFDLLAAATNHAGDLSLPGMELTMRALDERAIPYAGLGATLAAARAPTYAERPCGRVGLVAAATSFVPGTEAGHQRPDLGGRPGVSPLRLETAYEIPAETFDLVTDLASDLGLEAPRERYRDLGFPVDGDGSDGFHFPNLRGKDVVFEEADDFGIRREVNEEDRDAVLARVEAANRQADLVVASLHVHEGAEGHRNDHSVPAFLERFAHDCVDAGADVVFGHGPHVVRGIELYDGAPICYSLGNLAMQNETIPTQPAELYDRYDLSHDALPADLYDARTEGDGERIGFLADEWFWLSVVPICRFEGGEVERIDLHPIDLGFEEPRSGRGYPRYADAETGERIVERLSELSAPYGTEVGFEDWRGTIRIS